MPLTLSRKLQGRDWPLAVLSGVAGALLVLLFQSLLHLTETAMGSPDHSLVGVARQLTPWQRALAPALGGWLAGWILLHGRRLLAKTGGDYLEAVRVGSGRLGFRHTLINSLSSFCTVASGGSIGREGAMVSLSALAASLLTRRRVLPAARRRLLVACGVAAGWAAAYHAPLAGALFAAEVVRRRLRWREFPILLLASSCASLTVGRLLGLEPLYRTPPLPPLAWPALLAYCLLALSLGALAPVFIKLMSRTRAAFARIPWSLPWRMALGGAVVGGLAWFWPEMWGNGYSTVSQMLLSPPAWQLLAVLLACKLLATAATSGSGAVGGIFTPMLFAGASCGALGAQLLNAVWPETMPASGAALVGMAAFLAATAQAPLLAVTMMLEMSGACAMLAPLALAALLAARVSLLLGGWSLYENGRHPAARRLRARVRRSLGRR